MEQSRSQANTTNNQMELMAVVKGLESLKDELAARHRLKYTRVAGHSGHPENERCDELAVVACQQYV